jgi:hypothetical protein
VSAAQPRVVVLSLSYRMPQRIVTYIHDLLEAGVAVDLLIPARSSSLQAVEHLDPRVRVRQILNAEGDLLFRRIERKLVFGVPQRMVGAVRKLAPPAPVLAVVERGQRGLSGRVHGTFFAPVFKVTRPWVLARKARRQLEAFDLAGADRIVAADTPSEPLGWRLARRYPQIRATTALDRKPYIAD